MTDWPSIERRIIGFHQDEHDDWVADLECGHTQHVRHDPPWQNRPWVVTPEGRSPASEPSSLACHAPKGVSEFANQAVSRLSTRAPLPLDERTRGRYLYASA